MTLTPKVWTPHPLSKTLPMNFLSSKASKVKLERIVTTRFALPKVAYDLLASTLFSYECRTTRLIQQISPIILSVTIEKQKRHFD